MNYYATWRSNYFRVQDVAAFKAAMAKLEGVQVLEKETTDYFAVAQHPSCDGGIPCGKKDEKTGEWVEYNLADEVAAYLKNSEVAVFMETGAEGIRYMVGYAVAVNNKGKTTYIDLQQIYRKAQRLAGRDVQIMRVEY